MYLNTHYCKISIKWCRTEYHLLIWILSILNVNVNVSNMTNHNSKTCFNGNLSIKTTVLSCLHISTINNNITDHNIQVLLYYHQKISHQKSSWIPFKSWTTDKAYVWPTCSELCLNFIRNSLKAPSLAVLLRSSKASKISEK